MRLSRWLGLSVLVGTIVLVLVAPVWGAQGETVRISQSPSGQGVSGQSASAAISADGRYVAFHSSAFELVADDTNAVWDVFVHDRQTGVIDRVSVSSNGDQATFGDSFLPSISPNGRYISFASGAPDLTAGDTNGVDDIFVHDRGTGDTERVSLNSDGEEANSNSYASALSADGRFVAFESDASNLVTDDTNGMRDIFIHDRQTGQTRRVSVALAGQPNGASSDVSISADGRYVAFSSLASNLVEDDGNGSYDVFVHDLQSESISRVSLDSNGSEGDGDSFEPALSPDGRYISFTSRATNLVADDTNGVADVFVHDRQTGETTRVSVSSDGTEGDGDSLESAMSADARYVSFYSTASNLVVSDTNGLGDVFVHDRQTGETRRVSVASNGDQADGTSHRPTMSADGRYVGFDSLASNLAPDDENLTEDVFVHQYLPDPPPSTTTTTTTTTLPSGDWFIDIADSIFRDDINTIAAAGITRGCDPPVNDRFCPNDSVTRGQMAAFLNRALGLEPAGDQGLVDLSGSVFVGDVDALYASGITRGCNPPVNDRFCPNDPMTRGQMAAFLNRALGLDPAGDQGLMDISGSVFVDDVNALYASGITRGCNPPVNDRFCPNDPVTRGQMAAFLRRALLP